jgi:hypothetical protein
MTELRACENPCAPFWGRPPKQPWDIYSDLGMFAIVLRLNWRMPPGGKLVDIASYSLGADLRLITHLSANTRIADLHLSTYVIIGSKLAASKVGGKTCPIIPAVAPSLASNRDT